MSTNIPSHKSNGPFSESLTYSTVSISEAVLDKAKETPFNVAISYMNRSFSYKTLLVKIETLAKAFFSIGVKKGERILVCLPNTPQAVYVLYALNRIGAVAVFASPLSAEAELRFYASKCRCKTVVALDSLYPKLKTVMDDSSDINIILTNAADELGFLKKTMFKLKNPQKFRKANVITWDMLLKKGDIGSNIYISPQKPADTAVILFSGGTTGVPKAVELTNLNLNALAVGTEAVCVNNVRKVKMLSVLPIFHGFGLGICVHTVLFFGGECLLMPRFDKELAGKLIAKKKPQYIACVPAMLNSLMTSKKLEKADLSCLSGVFCGGDSLCVKLKESFDSFLKSRHATIEVRQGFGATECVAASCLMPLNSDKKDSVGLPYPDTFYKIVKPDTEVEVPVGETGEICISGKTVMKGYYDDKAETQKVLRVHSDGFVWFHSGDLGYMDKEGFVYFKQRLKRMIVTNGHNIYPSELEKVLQTHPKVKTCCAVGVSDPDKIQVPAMFVVLKNADDETNDTSIELLDFMAQNVSKYSLPKYLYFLSALPETPLKKVCYVRLEEMAEENISKK